MTPPPERSVPSLSRSGRGGTRDPRVRKRPRGGPRISGRSPPAIFDATRSAGFDSIGGRVPRGAPPQVAGGSARALGRIETWARRPALKRDRGGSRIEGITVELVGRRRGKAVAVISRVDRELDGPSTARGAWPWRFPRCQA